MPIKSAHAQVQIWVILCRFPGSVLQCGDWSILESPFCIAIRCFSSDNNSLPMCVVSMSGLCTQSCFGTLVPSRCFRALEDRTTCKCGRPRPGQSVGVHGLVRFWQLPGWLLEHCISMAKALVKSYSLSPKRKALKKGQRPPNMVRRSCVYLKALRAWVGGNGIVSPCCSWFKLPLYLALKRFVWHAFWVPGSQSESSSLL